MILINNYNLLSKENCLCHLREIDISDRSEQEGRSCVILYNFGNKELKKIQNFARIMGIKDQIVLNSKNGDETIKNILEDKIEKNRR